jgi:uncharacterized protein YebE (UPF0316 family)
MEWIESIRNSPELMNWVILPLMIFFARLTDVTLGTLRIVFVARGRKKIAPLLGFFEVLIWLAAIGQVMQNLNNVACYLAWAGGFAMGNLMGIIIEEKLALGLQVVRIITAGQPGALAQQLHGAGFGATRVDAHGLEGRVDLVFTIIRRKDLNTVRAIVRTHDPKAFYSVEDVRVASDLVYSPTGAATGSPSIFASIFPVRKAL